MLTVAGCGDDDSGSEGPSDEESIVLEAAEQTIQAGSAHLTIDYDGAFEGRMDLAADFTSDRARGTLRFTPLSPDAPQEVSGETYIDGPRTFMRFNDLEPSWIQASPGLGSTLENQPTALIESLGAALDDVEIAERSGTELGTPYSGTYDLTAVVERLPEETREGAEEQLEELDETAVPALIVVGTDGFIRELQFDIEFDEALIRVGMVVDDVGKPVEIGPPPKNVVSDEDASGL